MKFTLSWLKTHLDTSADAAKIAEALTAIGLEVESVEDHSAALRPFVVAEILEAAPHPQADRLQVCRVTDGTMERQVVCGAANARAGIRVILATEGVIIPNGGMKIKKSSIRGIESNGMLCSANELEIPGDSEGIVELSKDAELGESIVSVLGLDDPLFDIAITPNRGDALGVRGIARDLAAFGLGTLKPLLTQSISGNAVSAVSVAIDNSLACPLFVSATLQGLTNRESPEWLQRRLNSIGLKPISAIVDITNFIQFDLGRPLHAYDLAKISGNLHVRSARNGETFRGLNERDYTLEDGMVVIADGQKVLSLGGIIGGLHSAVLMDTHDIVLEAALFDPIQIAETGRKLQIDSDARYRFERRVDPLAVIAGFDAAAQLLLEICGGEISAVQVTGDAGYESRSIILRFARLKQFGGIDLPNPTATRILESLGFECEPRSGNQIRVTPPSWRPDIEGEADVIEEILRIHGYHNIPAVALPPPVGLPSTMLSLLQRRVQKARRILTMRGMLETISYAFIPDAYAQRFGSRRESMQLLNPISAELSTMRPSLLPNLVSAFSRNTAHGRSDLALFEIGRQFNDIAPDAQKYVIAGIRAGQSEARSHYKGDRTVDAMDAKADITELLTTFGMDINKLQLSNGAAEWYHPGRSATVSLGGKIILGYFGELHPKILAEMNVAERVVAFEFHVESLPEARQKSPTKAAFQRFEHQAVARDFAFIVPESVSAGTLLKAIEKAVGNLIATVRLFDVYQGANVGEGKKSLAFTLNLQPADRTLTDAEIEAVSSKVVDAATALGATLRQA